MKENRNFGIPEYLKHVERDVSNLIIFYLIILYPHEVALSNSSTFCPK